MNTPTHFFLNWVLARTGARRFQFKDYPSSAVLLGSIAPDLPLYGLVAWSATWYGWIQQWPPKDVARHMFTHLFYHDPVWISLHNILHSPTVLVLALVAWFLILRFRRSLHLKSTTTLPVDQQADVNAAPFWKSWWSWFFGSCLAHTLVDIPVHHDDGPLIFWPFNWSYRYESPLSYWDPEHFGIPVMIFEGILFLGLGVYLISVWFRRSASGSE